MAQQSENRKSATTACILIGVFLVAVFAAALVPRNSTQASSVDDTTTKALKETYRVMFGSKPVNASDYSALNTPVPMYLAAIIGLKHGGWNASTLENMTVYVSLAYSRFMSFCSPAGYGVGYDFINSVTAPVSDYSPKSSEESQGYYVTYRYVWQILVEPSDGHSSIPPPGMYFVDAATAELVSTGTPGS